ncbi:MAG: alpha/beta hydrolase [Roseiflexaceae bacterium]
MDPIAPLSRALVQLSDGLLRQTLLRLGVHERVAVLQGVQIHYYHRPAVPATPLHWWVQLFQTFWCWITRKPVDRRPTPLLLVHGLGDNALTWSFVLEFLGVGRDVYAIDLPGYGYSGLPAGQRCASFDQMRDLIGVFVREVIQRPTVIAGNSMGAWLAVRVAEQDPELVRELVLLNAGGAMLAGRSSWEPFRQVVAMPDLKAARLAIRQVVGFVPAPLIYIGQHGIFERFRRMVVQSFVETAEERDFLSPEELQQLQTPVSLLWGMEDTFLPPGSFEFFRQNLPNATVHVIRHCGHLPQRERPLAVARFLEQRAAAWD